MNPIIIRLWSRLKPQPVFICATCMGRGYLEKPWKRNSQWVLVRYPCPDCNPNRKEPCQ
jgi:hypothetical protein